MQIRAPRIIMVMVACTVLISAAGCASHSSPRVNRSEPPTTTLDLTPGGHRYGVGRIDVTFVDPARTTPADPAHHRPPLPQRTLPTVILYPTRPDRSTTSPSTRPPMADGHFPLFVFVHGRTASGPVYAPYLEQVAAAGYVVALPTMPLTSGTQAVTNFAAAADQPADVRFVIDEMLEKAANVGDVLNGHLDPNAVAVGGHSLGAITTLYFTNSCCHDPKVKAVVAASGEQYPTGNPDDTFAFPPPDLPILLLHGAKDPVIPYATGSRRIFADDRSSPRALVTFPRAGHADLLRQSSFDDSIIAFLDLTTRHDPTRWNRLPDRLRDNGDARLAVAGDLLRPEGHGRTSTSS